MFHDTNRVRCRRLGIGCCRSSRRFPRRAPLGGRQPLLGDRPPSSKRANGCATSGSALMGTHRRCCLPSCLLMRNAPDNQCAIPDQIARSSCTRGKRPRISRVKLPNELAHFRIPSHPKPFGYRSRRSLKSNQCFPTISGVRPGSIIRCHVTTDNSEQSSTYTSTSANEI